MLNNSLKYLCNKKIFFFDRDGTLTLGDSLISRADECLEKLNYKGKKYFIMTNNSSATPEEHIVKMNEFGLRVHIDNVLVSTDHAINFLLKNNLKNVFWMAKESVSRYLIRCGLIYDDQRPQVLLLTWDTEMTYQKLVKFCYLVQLGIPYYATHPDITCPTKHGPIPDIGTTIKIIELTTGVLPTHVFGKPDKGFLETKLNDLGLTPNEAVVIGDRLYTDIQIAKNINCLSVLVLSGETTRFDYKSSVLKADIVVNSVADLVPFL